MMRRIFDLHFCCGAAVAFAAMSLFQDFMGKDAYLELARSQWISWKISVPLCLILGGGACAVYVFFQRLAMKHDEKREVKG